MRPTWAEIRLDYVAANYRAVKELVGPSVKVMAVVKANAYGHGAVAIASRLEQEGVDWFGVALAEEAVELRAAGIKSPILCLGGFWQEEQARECIAHDLTPTIYRIDMLETLSAAARAADRSAKFHLKLDTGMGRLGITPEQLPAFLDRLAECPQLKLEGVMSHFASADELEQSDFTTAQIAHFQECLALVRARGLQPEYEHISNSAGTHDWPGAHGNMVRAGGLLYGFKDTLAPVPARLPLLPVLSLHSRIILLKRVPAGQALGYGGTFRTTRESLIATLPIGYHDGLRRAHSNNGRVLVRGHYAPIVGRISMDLTLIDLTDLPDAALGDEVIIIGRSGEQAISAEEVGATIATISYEVSCALSDRVPRIYKN